MKQLPVWLVIIATALGLLFFNNWEQEKPRSSNNKQLKLPSGYVSGAKIRQFSEEGKLASEIITPEIRLFDEKGFLEQPVIYNYHENCNKGWKTTADQGQLNNYQEKKDSTLILSGNVVMQQANKRTILKTASMEFYPKRSYVLGNEAVTITQPNSLTTASGFSIDLKNQYYRLLEDVRNYYEPGKTADPNNATDHECLFSRP